MAGRGVATALLLVLATAGCADSDDIAKSRAIDAARESAEGMRVRFQGASTGRSGRELLESLGRVLPTGDLVAVGEPALDGEDAVIDILLVTKGEAGGGLSYADYRVRMCVQYRVTGGVEPTSTVTDIPCDQAPALDSGPVEQTITVRE